MKLAALFTGGKDSTYAIYLAQKQGHEIVCLITVQSENQDSYMFHTPAIELTELQAEDGAAAYCWKYKRRERKRVSRYEGDYHGGQEQV